MKQGSPYIGIDPPEGFQSFDPNGQVEIFHRHLPHWRQAGATYAVTFRQADCLPREKIEEIKNLREEWGSKHPEPRVRSSTERY